MSSDRRQPRGPEPTRLFSMTQAAEILGCSRTHIYGLIAAGHLRPVEIKATGTRSKTRIRADDLDTFIEGRTREVPAVRPTDPQFASSPLASRWGRGAV